MFILLHISFLFHLWSCSNFLVENNLRILFLSVTPAGPAGIRGLREEGIFDGSDIESNQSIAGDNKIS